ncbi:hypothetical protein [Enterobacter hormaechei]
MFFRKEGKRHRLSVAVLAYITPVCLCVYTRAQLFTGQGLLNPSSEK